MKGKQAVFSNNFKFVEYQFRNYRYSDNRSGAPMHFLAVLEEGTCRIVSQAGSLELRAGDGFYIPMGLSYQSYWEGERIRFLSYGFRLFPDAAGQRFLLQKLPAAKIRSIPIGDPDAAALGQFFGVLGQLVPHMASESACQAKQLTEAALKYMRMHPTDRISQVAHSCCVSESGLYAAFRRELGITPNHARQQVLVEHSVHLLTSTDLSPSQISDSLGFSSVSYFRKVLRQHTGQSPLQIRKTQTPLP